ncbi:hypothetical protein QQX98_009108 [Neonectria punicea]|uniref:Peptidase S8/S53 domain-containing protein n=1 Tax=Neonectria punicea TaxID=979145 RepID=A0ABR1GT93_9HYPO
MLPKAAIAALVLALSRVQAEKLNLCHPASLSSDAETGTDSTAVTYNPGETSTGRTTDLTETNTLTGSDATTIDTNGGSVPSSLTTFNGTATHITWLPVHSSNTELSGSGTYSGAPGSGTTPLSSGIYQASSTNTPQSGSETEQVSSTEHTDSDTLTGATVTETGQASSIEGHSATNTAGAGTNTASHDTNTGTENPTGTGQSDTTVTQSGSAAGSTTSGASTDKSDTATFSGTTTKLGGTETLSTATTDLGSGTDSTAAGTNSEDTATGTETGETSATDSAVSGTSSDETATGTEITTGAHTDQISTADSSASVTKSGETTTGTEKSDTATDQSISVTEPTTTGTNTDLTGTETFSGTATDQSSATESVTSGITSDETATGADTTASQSDSATELTGSNTTTGQSTIGTETATDTTTGTGTTTEQTFGTTTGQTGRFTISQDPNYSTITAPITTTTHIDTTSGDTSTTTDLPIIIGIGSWFWFPLPGPGLIFPPFPAPIPPVVPPGGDPDDPENTNNPTTDAPSSTEEETSTTATTSKACTATGGSGLGRRQDEGNDDGDSCELTLEFIVYPSDGSNSVTTAAIYAKMLTMVDADSIATSDSSCAGVLFWTVQMTMSQAEELIQFANVATVYQPCSDACFDPSTDLVQQPNSPDDLVLVSQFKDQPLSWYRSNYIYEESGGRDVEVYIVDTGANLNNVLDTSTLRPDVESADDDNGGKKGHGTCILSRMGGHIHGIAKNASPVIVRMPRRPAAVNPVEDYLEGIQKIVDDVGSGNKRAVVSMSWFYPRQLAGGVFTFKDLNGGDASDAPRDTLRRLLRLLASKGVSLMTGSGNNGANSIDGFPAEFGDPNAGLNYIPEMIVVGGVDAQGLTMYSGTNRDASKGLPHVYAPGVDIQCADFDPTFGTYRSTSGTSPGKFIATVAVAGMAAYLIGLGNLQPFAEVDVSTPLKVKELMLEWAWERAPGLRTIVNGVRPADAGISSPACPLVRRQDSDGNFPDLADCSQAESSTTVPTTLLTTTRQSSTVEESTTSIAEEPTTSTIEETTSPVESPTTSPVESPVTSPVDSPATSLLPSTSPAEPPTSSPIEPPATLEPPAPTSTAIIYVCQAYVSPRNTNNCDCEPQNCMIGPGCSAKILLQGEDGCDENCDGCVIP